MGYQRSNEHSVRVKDNNVKNATRLGIVVIQELGASLSIDNIISDNRVAGSGSDGIQIQGDHNLVRDNEVTRNGGYGIRFCGPASSPVCVAPGNNATASNNVATHNTLKGNALGSIADDGSDNRVRREQ